MKGMLNKIQKYWLIPYPPQDHKDWLISFSPINTTYLEEKLTQLLHSKQNLHMSTFLFKTDGITSSN